VETIQFEGIKTGLRQSKEGYNLTLAVHPDDLPDDLMRDFVGSRYMVVMVRIGDDEQPVNREVEFAGGHAVKIAGMLCRDPDFWSFVFDVHGDEITSESECVQWLQIFLDLSSRSELKTNNEARELFIKLRKGFDKWKAN
jgi:hypothetical protein